MALSEAQVLTAGGVQQVADAKALEILFQPVQGLDSELMGRCKSLRSLTLIDTGLRDVSGISNAKNLLRVCLTSQPRLLRFADRSASAGDGLGGAVRLPLLRDLLLHDCGLTECPVLTACPRLQRLWLQGNKITSLAGGLANCADLRELWVMDNRLTCLEGIESCVSLQVLNVAGNPIRNLLDLPRLAPLQLLRSLSFADPHYGHCPVVDADTVARSAGLHPTNSPVRGAGLDNADADPAYRARVVCSMRGVVVLDAIAVTEAERSAATASYAARADAMMGRLASVAESGAARAQALADMRLLVDRSETEVRHRVTSSLEALVRATSAALRSAAQEAAGRGDRLREARAQLEARLRAAVARFDAVCADEAQVVQERADADDALAARTAGEEGAAAGVEGDEEGGAAARVRVAEALSHSASDAVAVLLGTGGSRQASPADGRVVAAGEQARREMRAAMEEFAAAGWHGLHPTTLGDLSARSRQVQTLLSRVGAVRGLIEAEKQKQADILARARRRIEQLE